MCQSLLGLPGADKKKFKAASKVGKIWIKQLWNVYVTNSIEA